ncbi:MAG: indolepyruvate ferredoxin oxidoreductase subunit alpha [Syntrophobacterales bacterium]|nr:indolepyruvate ferredoxin oxidoreductase subunit alpha [Syntrophobacterales bacterium]
MKELTSNETSTLFMLGNEAIVRAALESGVRFVSAYPGTPSSEIIDRMYEIRRETGVRVEYAANEKVSMETAAAVAMCGVRSLCSMKHVGLNVAADAFMTLAYVGVKGGMVIVTADDPSLHSSQNEQDNRFYAKMALVPMLEPATPHEAYEMVKEAFEISEKYGTPSIVRTTTRINHARGVVKVGEYRKIEGEIKGVFDKDPFRYVVVPMVGRRLRVELLERLRKLEEVSEKSSFQIIRGKGTLGIITSGVSYLYVEDAVRDLGILEKVKILKLGMTFPIPRKLLQDFLSEVESVLVVEELEPYLEEAIRIVAQESKWAGKIAGKEYIPRAFELNVPLVRAAISRFWGISYKPRYEAISPSVLPRELPQRPPNLCPGCPHRATYHEIKRIFGSEALYPTDIGCYTLGLLPPLSMADFLICMGSSVSTAGGFSVAQDRPVIAFVGDSTFIHAGIPALINSVFHDHSFLLVILDNSTTAMTGHQPHPGASMTREGLCEPKVRIEEIVRACGAKAVEIINPIQVKRSCETISSLRDSMEKNPGVYVLISRSPCPLLERRIVKKARRIVFRVNETCDGCVRCLGELACPAFYKEGDRVQINPLMCIGCSVCAQICKSIKPVKLH